ncbi:MAG: ribonuclease R [Chloroflexota bacterium]
MEKESLLAALKGLTKPLSFRELIFHLGLSHQERRVVKRILRDLVREGLAVRTRKGLYGPPEEMGLVTGCFEAHRDGFGFVIPDRPGERDIFIPPRATAGAMHNDRVVARIESMRRREGAVIRVLERSHTRVVGIFESGRNGCFVRPSRRRFSFDLTVAPNDRCGARSGDRVLAEITEYPSDKRPAAARIVKVMGKAGSAAEESEIVIDEYGLPRRFSHAVLEEVRALPSTRKLPVPEVSHRRRDLRALPTVTIDGEKAKDFDDAVSVRRTPQGFRLWVHIADVGHYVGWGSLMDDEARTRGTSVYFPDAVIPMLPKVLSEDLCSLKPGEERPALTVEMDFDSGGERRQSHFYQSVIMSDERMTYTSVRKILVDGDTRERERHARHLGEFDIMEELCLLLRDRRNLKGSLDFDLPEPEVLLDIRGNPEAIVRAERNIAHMIIEEFMIVANEAVAEHLTGMGVPLLYRVHEEPDPSKLEDLAAFMRSFGFLKARQWIRPGDISGLIGNVRGTRDEDIMHYVILRSLKQARYSPVNVGHFGLASGCYTHFTSPIRRYPDLVVHRILKEVLGGRHMSGKRTSELESLLPDIAFHSSRMERQADEAEKAVVDSMRVWFMRDKVSETFDGRIVSVMPHGLRVRLNEYYVDGFLHVSYMTDDFYRYDEKTLSLVGLHRKKRFTIGRELRVRIERVDMEEREVVLAV